MSEVIADDDPRLLAMAADSAKFKERMAYVSLQIDLLEPEEKMRFEGEFKDVSKSMLPLRKAMHRKEKIDDGIPWEFYGCVALLLLLFG